MPKENRDKFVKLTYRLHPDQPKRLLRLSKVLSRERRRYVSVNELVRDAIDDLIANRGL